jgi:hypothetical protein
MEYHEIALGIATMLNKNRFQMKTSEKENKLIVTIHPSHLSCVHQLRLLLNL